MWDRQDGAVAVEMSLLVLFVLVPLFFGIVQFSLAFHRTQALQAASHEGARLAALPGVSVAEIVSQVKTSMDPVSDPDEDWSATCPAPEGEICWMVSDQDGATFAAPTDLPCSMATTRTVTVWVQQPYTVRIPVFRPLGPYFLTGKGEFRCER